MQINFNAYDFDPSQGSAICFPLADYKVEITAAEPKVVKDNPSAGYLELSLTVVEGDLRGMVQKDRLNLFHTNEVPKRISHQQLAAYCFAINRPYVQNTEDLIGGRCICTIGPQESSDKYSEVKVVKCMDGTLPTRPHAQGQAAAPQAAPQAPPPAPQPPQAPQAAPLQPQATPPWNSAGPAAPSWAAQPTPAAQAPTNAAASLPPWAK
jgi:hypothetical protein